jgi:ferrous iron transport protein B
MSMPIQGWKNGATEQRIEDAADNPQSRRNSHNHLDRESWKRIGKRTRTYQEANGHGPISRNTGENVELRTVPRADRDNGQRIQTRSWKGHGGEDSRGENHEPTRKLTIALAGNANVGKSVIFNHLTGLHQHIGNWPGKTVEKAEGTLYFKGYLIDVVDLPGIYSLSTFSLEELVSREYIAFEKPDLVINVVDASVLERNLFFTLQLMELEAPMVVALNQIDIAAKKGIEIDSEKLSEILGVPVVPTVAIKGNGVYELLEKVVESVEKGVTTPTQLKYGKEIEERIETLTDLIKESGFKYPARWTAIKLLEGDEEIEKQINASAPEVLETVKEQAAEVEKLHGHTCETVMVSERYETARCIANQVQKIRPQVRQTLTERVHELTTQSVSGYLIMAGVLLLIFWSVFAFGNVVSDYLGILLFSLEPMFTAAFGEGIVKELLWGGVMEGVIASITIVVPYIVPFYFVLYLLEDSGYLSRIAYLMDALMHKIGLHGKAFIPVMLAFGCNVPACLACRIMETKRERLLATFVVTLIPCAAVTVVVLGLVGKYVGIEWALALYVINMIIVIILGRFAFRALPGEPTGLIMEMGEYRIPHLKTVLTQTSFRLSEYIKMALPLIIVSSLAIKAADILGLLQPMAQAMSPLTVTWLGLRPEMGVALFFGVIRKELTLIMLATLVGANLTVLMPIQMVVFTIVIMLYIPCVATIAALIKEIGWKNAMLITVFKILFALLVGGVTYRILSMIGMP